jgi:hypothetical protein
MVAALGPGAGSISPLAAVFGASPILLDPPSRWDAGDASRASSGVVCASCGGAASALSTAEPCRCAWAGAGDVSFTAGTALGGENAHIDGILRRGGGGRGRRRARMSSLAPVEPADAASGLSPFATANILDISLTQERPRRRRSQRGFSGVPTPARAPTQPWPAPAQSASRVRFADEPASAPLAAAAAAALAAFNAARTLADDAAAARADAVAARADAVAARAEVAAVRAENEALRAEVEQARSEAHEARASAAAAASTLKRAAQKTRAGEDAPSVGARAKKRAKPNADAGAPRAIPAWAAGGAGGQWGDDDGGAGAGAGAGADDGIAAHSAQLSRGKPAANGFAMHGATHGAGDVSQIFTSPESDLFAPPVSSRILKPAAQARAPTALQPVDIAAKKPPKKTYISAAPGGRSVLSLVFCGGGSEAGI